MSEKLAFMKKAFLWTAIVSAIAFVVIGILAPIEPGMSVFGHVLKTFFMWVWVTVILECLMYTAGQVVYDWKHNYKEKYGKGWFWKGIKEDLQYIKEQITWKKVFKTIGIYILFFAIFFLVIWGLEALVP